MKQKKRNKGVFTVELTLIFPVIFLAILSVMYLSIIHYQNITTSAMAMQSANRIAAYWQFIEDERPSILYATNARDMLVSDDFENCDPYRYILGTGSSNEMRKRNSNVYIQNQMGRLTKYYEAGEAAIVVENVVEKKGFLLNPYIEVSVTRQYVNPLGNLLEAFGVGSREERTVRATAPLMNQTELIRNIEFIEEQIEKLKS